MTEAELIAQLKASSHRAFNEIYRLYAGRLFAFLMQHCKVREDAEEIVEDVFVRLWTIRKSIRQEETLKSLLFTISRNLVINAYRRTVNSLEYAEYVEAASTLSADNPSKKIEYEDFVKRLRRELSCLPATQQQVIRLSRAEGLTNKEIAEKLSLSEQTVKNQLSLGLKQLRRKLYALSPLLCCLFGLS